MGRISPFPSPRAALPLGMAQTGSLRGGFPYATCGHLADSSGLGERRGAGDHEHPGSSARSCPAPCPLQNEGTSLWCSSHWVSSLKAGGTQGCSHGPGGFTSCPVPALCLWLLCPGLGRTESTAVAPREKHRCHPFAEDTVSRWSVTHKQGPSPMDQNWCSGGFLGGVSVLLCASVSLSGSSRVEGLLLTPGTRFWGLLALL